MESPIHTLPLGAFVPFPLDRLDDVFYALLNAYLLSPAFPERNNFRLDIKERYERLRPSYVAAKQRLIQSLLKELNRFAPPFCYVGHAPHDENNWGVWIDLGKLHEAEEKGQLVQETQRPTKGRSRYVLIHDQTGLRLFKRRGWVEVWKV